jgi:hypothetical protein
MLAKQRRARVGCLKFRRERMASTVPTLENPAPEPTPTPIFKLPLTSVGPRGANRRFVPRMNVYFTVRIRGERSSYEGVDISFGGLMCTGELPTWPGNLLDLDMILPGDHRTVHAQGRVVELVSYRNRIAMRIRFENIDAAARKRIANWMAHRAQVA